MEKEINVTVRKTCAKLRASSNFCENTPRSVMQSGSLFLLATVNKFSLFFVINRHSIVQISCLSLSGDCSRKLKENKNYVMHNRSWFPRRERERRSISICLGKGVIIIVRIDVKGTNYNLARNAIAPLKKGADINLKNIFHSVLAEIVPLFIFASKDSCRTNVLNRTTRNESMYLVISQLYIKRQRIFLSLSLFRRSFCSLI